MILLVYTEQILRGDSKYDCH